MEPKLTCTGTSSDWRTNRWAVTCGCGEQFTPPTTMLATQVVQCPKCGKRLFVDYDAEPPSARQRDD